MKKFILIIITLTAINLLLGSPQSAVAQQQQQNSPGGRIARALNLTDDQKAQLKPLLKSARQQFQSVRNDNTLTQDQKAQKLQAVRLQLKTQLDQILTPAQQQELQVLRSQWRQRRSGRQPGAAQP